MQTLTYNNVILPHNRQDQFPPVDPFDQELPKENKYCVFSHTTCKSELSMAFKRIMRINDKYLYHYCSTLPRAQLFLWTPSAQQNLVVQSSPLVQSPQGDLDDLWHPKHAYRISYRMADYT